LQRINVSIDALDAPTFSALSRGGDLAQVLAGIDAALDAGFTDLKTNTVVIGGSSGPRDPSDASPGNEDQVVAIARWAFERGLTPRFLELMTVGEGARIRGRVVGYPAIRARLAELLGEEAGSLEREVDRGPARYVGALGAYAGKRIGFITGSSDTFCEGCDRLRVTSIGGLRPCLATSDEVSLRPALDGGLLTVGDALADAWAMKPDGSAWRGCTEESAATVNMRATGG
jgi:cyclic pyranopterin phosphate synthase